MQSIQIARESEGGGVIETFDDINFADVVNLLIGNGTKEEFPWLWSIDPYGYTIFNIHQVPYVIAELRQLSAKISDGQLIGIIGQVIAFLSRIEQHIYIRFTGD